MQVLKAAKSLQESNKIQLGQRILHSNPLDHLRALRKQGIVQYVEAIAQIQVRLVVPDIDVFSVANMQLQDVQVRVEVEARCTTGSDGGGPEGELAVLERFDARLAVDAEDYGGLGQDEIDAVRCAVADDIDDTAIVGQGGAPDFEAELGWQRVEGHAAGAIGVGGLLLMEGFDELLLESFRGGLPGDSGSLIGPVEGIGEGDNVQQEVEEEEDEHEHEHLEGEDGFESFLLS